MRAYFKHHQYALKSAAKQLSSSWLASLMTIFVIALTLVLPMMLWLLIANSEPVINQWQGDPKATIYFKKDVSENDIEALQASVSQLSFVKSSELVSADEALESFEKNAQFSDVLNVLEENPLPASLVLAIATETDAAEIEKALNVYAEDVSVDEVRYDLQWVKRLQAIVNLVKKIIWLVVTMVLVAAMLIISNTIRLIIANRTREIDILNRVGATHAFICRPFLYSGLFKGIVAALLAFAIVYLSVSWLKPGLNQLYSLYFAQNEFIGFTARQQFAIVLTSGILGWLSSWLTVKVFLLKYKP